MNRQCLVPSFFWCKLEDQKCQVLRERLLRPSDLVLAVEATATPAEAKLELVRPNTRDMFISQMCRTPLDRGTWGIALLDVPKEHAFLPKIDDPILDNYQGAAVRQVALRVSRGAAGVPLYLLSKEATVFAETQSTNGQDHGNLLQLPVRDNTVGCGGLVPLNALSTRRNSSNGAYSRFPTIHKGVPNH